MVKIKTVSSNSLAEKAGILAGDELCSINGHIIRDVLDYRFYLTDTLVSLLLHRGADLISVEIRKGEYQDIGLDFETPLMDKKHCCTNRCVFCFIDQLPQGMRKTLYFKDDDDRLSFLHGNYVTLTNLKDEDIDRIITMHISPINVSVHTTNPELRVKMMKNKYAGDVLRYLRRLADAGIALCTQIVLCKGLNDGAELDRSMRDLLSYYPALRSCAIVPVGLTRYREKLYPLQPFTPEDCAAIIKQINAFGDECLQKYGTRIFYPADEFYVKAELPLPSEEFYEDYAQLENGVGMLTSLRSEFEFELQYLDDYNDRIPQHRTVSVATGTAAYTHLLSLCKRLEECARGLTINVYPIQNNFFGTSVTVAGLLTGKDVSEQLAECELGDELLIPAVMLKADEDIFLDDMTPNELSARLNNIPIRAVKSDGVEFLQALLGVSETEV